MSGREDTRLDGLMVKRLEEVVYNTDQLVPGSKIADVGTHQFVPLHYLWGVHTQPLVRSFPYPIWPARFPVESRSAIATIHWPDPTSRFRWLLWSAIWHMHCIPSHGLRLCDS